MTLAAILDSLDKVPEALKPFYVEQDGKFVLDVEVETHPGALGVKSALDKERAANKAKDKQLAAWTALGLTADQIAEMKKAADDAEAKKATAAGDFQKIQAQRDEAHKKELDTLTAKLGKRESFIEKVVKENVARQALAPVAHSVDLLLPHVLKSVKVIEDPETGEFSAVVVDAKGNPRMDPKDYNNPMGIGTLVEEMSKSDAFAPAFKGTGSSGSGTPPAGGPVKGVKVIGEKDDDAFFANLGDIGAGKVMVQ